ELKSQENSAGTETPGLCGHRNTKTAFAGPTAPKIAPRTPRHRRPLPAGPTTPTITKNHFGNPKGLQNHPKPLKRLQNHPKPLKRLQNHPKPLKPLYKSTASKYIIYII